ncbi:polyprenyl diphosphate synthase [Albirhodobacter sp. R86504]|uniref:polyprenyl diphosphate synthase n=1 Tax=Albirhodobacter sp. R86504 TaxID=3093848 RepID=UPI00366E3032
MARFGSSVPADHAASPKGEARDDTAAPLQTDYGVNHVAFIMDGNGRWAVERGWPRLVGHRKGAERVKTLVQACPAMGVKWVTVYAFSTENWKRSTEEVLGLMRIFARYIEKEAGTLSKDGVRMRFIGDRSKLDAKLRKLMDGIEERTAANTRINFTVAINYGGRDEIVRAAKALALRVASGEVSPEAINAEAFEAHLDTAGLPDPDLVIRTSGESRTSNFLPWQAAYAEYEFTPTLWPDFTPEKLAEILDGFGGRERRFGGV